MMTSIIKGETLWHWWPHWVTAAPPTSPLWGLPWVMRQDVIWDSHCVAGVPEDIYDCTAITSSLHLSQEEREGGPWWLCCNSGGGRRALSPAQSGGEGEWPVGHLDPFCIYESYSWYAHNLISGAFRYKKKTFLWSTLVPDEFSFASPLVSS